MYYYLHSVTEKLRLGEIKQQPKAPYLIRFSSIWYHSQIIIAINISWVPPVCKACSNASHALTHLIHTCDIDILLSLFYRWENKGIECLGNFPKVSQLIKPLHSFCHPWVMSIPSVPKAHLGWGRSQGFWLLRFFIPKWKQFLTRYLTLRLCTISTLHHAGFVLNKDPSSVESSFFVILLMLLSTCEWWFRVNKILFTYYLISFEKGHMEPLLRGLQN